MIYFIAIFMAVLNAWIDYLVISNGNSPDHTKNAIVRGFVLFIVSVIVGGPWWIIGLRFISGAATFWIVFEILLNRLRRRHWLYVGENAKTDLVFKKLFPRNTGVHLLIIKVTILIVSICLILLFGEAS